MNLQHVILYQKNVCHPRYIVSLLAKEREIVIHIVKNFDEIKIQNNLNKLHCILYECDDFTKKNIVDIKKLEDLNIPYLILVNCIGEDICIDNKNVILKSKELSLAPVFSSQLIVRIKSLYLQVAKAKKNVGLISTKIIAIGASTGGPHAISTILKELPVNIGGIVIVQHMNDNNITSFVNYLDGICDLKVKVAQENDIVRNGVVYIARQRQHLTIKKADNGYHLHYTPGKKINCMCPSIDVLFHSVALQAGISAVGILLTGMGSDGSRGLKEMKKAGALTIIQDEKTSDIYSMPKEAKKINAYQKELPLHKISECLIQYFKIKEKGKLDNGKQNENNDCRRCIVHEKNNS